MRKFSIQSFVLLSIENVIVFSTSLNAFKKVINPFLSYFICFALICLLGSELSEVLESQAQRFCTVKGGPWSRLSSHRGSSGLKEVEFGSRTSTA